MMDLPQEPELVYFEKVALARLLRIESAAKGVIDEFTGAEDGEYPSVENLLRAMDT